MRPLLAHLTYVLTWLRHQEEALATNTSLLLNYESYLQAKENPFVNNQLLPNS